MKDIIKRLAEKNNTHPYIIKQEIAKAIEAGMANPDPKAQAAWKKIAPDGKAPAPEELIDILTEKMIDSLL